jgi:tRNA(Ile2) C34 agmatinyltransferase TiaS
MKEQTLLILEKVKNGELTAQVAQEQLFVLFGVSGQRQTVCPNCQSTDIHFGLAVFKCKICGCLFG